MKRQLLKNAVSAGVVHIASTLVALAATPFLVHGLGLEQYGFLALLIAASKYGGFTDFGIGPSLTRQIAHHHAIDEADGVRKTATFGALFYSTLLLVSSTIAWIFGPAIIGFGHFKDPAFVADATLLFRAFVFSFFAGSIGGSFQSLLAGIGHLQLATKSLGALSIAGTVLTVAVISSHHGLRGLAVFIIVWTIVNVAILYTLARRTYGGPIFVSPLSLRWPTARALLSTGGWIQLSTIMVMLYAETDQVIVGAVLGLAASGLFDIGRKLARANRAIAYYFGTALMPAVAALQSRGQHSMEEIVVDGTRYLAVMTVFVSGLVYAIVPEIVRLWIGVGPHDDSIVHVTRVLLLVYLLDSINQVAITMLRGAGTPKLETFYSISNAVVNVGLTLALVRPFGMNGILSASVGGMAIASVVFALAYSRFKGYDLRRSLGLPMLRLAIVGVACLAVVTFGFPLVPIAPNDSVAYAIYALVAQGLLYSLAFAAAVRIGAIFSERDYAFAKAATPHRFHAVLESPLVRGLLGADRRPGTVT